MIAALLQPPLPGAKSVMVMFFLPGSRANAARHFLCRAPVQSVDGEKAHAALPIAGNAFRNASKSDARTIVRRPIFLAGNLLSRISL
jgi:hypothetical protein